MLLPMKDIITNESVIITAMGTSFRNQFEPMFEHVFDLNMIKLRYFQLRPKIFCNNLVQFSPVTREVIYLLKSEIYLVYIS